MDRAAQRLAEDLVGELVARGLTAATAESCTGGLVSSAITSVPGSSAVFGFGFVTYANEAKEALLGVDPRTLATRGAVSREVAEQMATGARARSGADIAVAITGIAGPGGGSPSKPVGLVWFAVAGPEGVRAERRVFRAASRDLVRTWSSQQALRMLRQAASKTT